MLSITHVLKKKSYCSPSPKPLYVYIDTYQGVDKHIMRLATFKLRCWHASLSQCLLICQHNLFISFLEKMIRITIMSNCCVSGKFQQVYVISIQKKKILALFVTKNIYPEDESTKKGYSWEQWDYMIRDCIAKMPICPYLLAKKMI